MRLIDADALKALFDKRYDSACMQMHTRDNKVHSNVLCAGVNWGRKTIANAPTVDAVEVVRCKDCKYCFIDLSSRNAHLCMRKEVGFIVRRKLDDYCSYGERKDNE